MKRLERQDSNPSLPEDVMVEILMRLPLESVINLQRVSKQWKNLINDPKFFYRYRDETHALVLVKDEYYCLQVKHGAKVTANRRRRHPPFTMHPIKFGASSFEMDKHPSAIVVCNWTTCVVSRSGHFLLHNLLTGASCVVADAPSPQEPCSGYTKWMCYGFGYEGYEDDYKILVACDYGHGLNRSVQKEDNSLFWVYSSRSRVWERLEGFPYAEYDWHSFGNMVRHFRCCLNGVLHWGTRRARVYLTKPVIVTYDLRRCRFGEISVPQGYDHSFAYVCELGGQLCCWGYKSECGYCVWAMKEYGSESWTMLFSIRVSIATFLSYAYDQMKPVMLYQCKDGGQMVLLAFWETGSLYWYDIDNAKLNTVYKSTWKRTRLVGGRGGKTKAENKGSISDQARRAPTLGFASRAS